MEVVADAVDIAVTVVYYFDKQGQIGGNPLTNNNNYPKSVALIFKVAHCLRCAEKAELKTIYQILLSW